MFIAPAMAYYSNFSRRLVGTAPVSFLKSVVKSGSHSPLRNASTTMPSQRSFPSFSRTSVYKLGCVQSLMPLHSVVATARMISYVSADSRNCGTFSIGALYCNTHGP
ncbi:uncharacterized protein LOC114741865 [Neltuma alba]|uniref:uncharacterized protein LOC114741865 n=1 Tax=Neltuma alba TaxID=207710 RepID=UPI0010A3D4D5|nr:uncharacterized protein LOC114741865 [Prosopis alba]